MSVRNPLWNHRCIYTLSWDRFEVLILSICEQLRNAGVYPDLIVGIAKGGLIPSVRLFYLLDPPDYGVISIKRNANSQYFPSRISPQLSWTQIPSSSFSCALLVDDIVGSGETLSQARQELAKQTSAVIKTASVAVNTNGGCQPDFWGCEIDDWVHFPWEMSTEFHENALFNNIPFVPL
jgi:uncharacterized protein